MGDPTGSTPFSPPPNSPRLSENHMGLSRTSSPDHRGYQEIHDGRDRYLIAERSSPAIIAHEDGTDGAALEEARETSPLVWRVRTPSENQVCNFFGSICDILFLLALVGSGMTCVICYEKWKKDARNDDDEQNIIAKFFFMEALGIAMIILGLVIIIIYRSFWLKHYLSERRRIRHNEEMERHWARYGSVRETI